MNLDKAEKLALELMKKHSLTNWELQWVRATKFGGRMQVTMRGNVVVFKRIQLSKSYIRHASDEDVRDVILHEIAHALVFDSGKNDLFDHGPIWREVVRSIGGIDNTIVKRYRTKPRKSFHNAYIPGRKEETLGKFRVVTAC